MSDREEALNMDPATEGTFHAYPSDIAFSVERTEELEEITEGQVIDINEKDDAEELAKKQVQINNGGTVKVYSVTVTEEKTLEYDEETDTFTEV